MKKYFNYLGIMAAAAMTLVSCAKEIDTVSKEDAISEEGIPFEFVANPETKTTIDGLQTKWAADDAVNLFHAVAGSTTYESDGEFTIASEDLATGTFKGTLKESLSSGSYDWYAVYPYNKYITSIHNVGDNPARYYIGCRSDKAQVQTGNNSTAHLSGANYPLYGKASAVSYDAMPSVTLSNIASFVKIDVTNKNEEPLTVSNIVFTAPDGSEIVGQYNIDFAAEPLVFTKYSTYAADYATLTVESGEPIAKDETASFYIGIKPFTAAAGSEFTVSVNGYEKTIVTAHANTFEASKVKTVAFDYDYVDSVVEPEGNGWYQVLRSSWLKAGDKIVFTNITNTVGMGTQGGTIRTTVTGLTMSDSKLNIGESVQWELVNGSTSGTWAFKEGDNYLVWNSGNSAEVSSTLNESSSWNVSIESDGTAIITNANTPERILQYNSSSPRFACYTSSQQKLHIFKQYSLPELDAISVLVAPDNSNKTIEVTWADVSGATNYSVECTGQPTQNIAPGVEYAQFTGLEYGTEYTITLTASADGFESSSDSDVVVLVDPTAKLINAIKTSIDDVPAAGVSTVLESDVYELVNATDGDITVTYDGSVVTAAAAADGDVLYDVANNAGAARSGWIKIAVAGGNTIQIDVNQLAGVSSKTYTITWNSTNNSKSVSAYTETWTVTADGLTCNMQNFNNNGNQWEYVKCGRKNTASVATIITSTAIPEAIRTVTLTIDALTVSKINSIKLYTSSDSSSWTEAGTFDKGTGDKSVVVSSPAVNEYYKIECDCASGSSNGLLTIKKLVFTTN